MTNGYHKDKKDKPKKAATAKKKVKRGAAGRLVPKELEPPKPQS
jgi:hypothetical protein